MTTFTDSDTAVPTVATEFNSSVNGNGFTGQTYTTLGPRSDSDYYQGVLIYQLFSSTDVLLFGGTVQATGPTPLTVLALTGTSHNHTISVKTGPSTLSQATLSGAVTYFKT